jgi:UDP-sugar transporter A1/2/3
MVATRRATRAASSKRTGYIFCILLAAQYGLQPFLKVFIADGVNKVSLVLGTEMAKVLLGLAGMLYEGSLASNFAAWNPKGAAFAVIPSLIYAAQNYLLVFGYQTMDSVTFNCLNQSKLVSTALCLYLLFGTKQSLVQMGALAGLLIAGVMLQDGGGESQGANTAASEAETAVGVAAVLAASALSGVASAACQYAMQRIGTSAHVFTLEMAFVAIPALLISQASVISARDPAALFVGWDAFTLIPVFCSAFGGMCVG